MLYKQVFIDKAAFQFYGLCADCEKKILAGKIPLLCRDQSLLQQYADGSVGGLRQKLYNRRYANAVQHLARFLNRCPHCGKWVCDDCFDLSDGYGACQSCMGRSAQKQEIGSQEKGSGVGGDAMTTQDMQGMPP